MNDIPLSLYIHIPWCIKKCYYCDFNSHAKKNNIPEKEYIDALIQDLTLDLPLIQNRKIKSIFIGGGTPSLFSAEAIETLLNKIKCLIQMEDILEVTMETNPGTIEHDDFIGYKHAGVNRISLGVQTFNNNTLKTLGRIHDNSQADFAIKQLINTNFNSFNIDLMYGLPGQTIEEALIDLKKAISYNPKHLSWYNLTIEPNTIFYAKRPLLPSNDDIYEMEQAGHKFLIENNFEHYEISAFTKDKNYCQHNMNYWEFGDYLGIGAGAHGKITDLKNFTITRYNKTRQPNAYLDRVKQNNFIADSIIIPKKEIPFEESHGKGIWK